MFKASVQPCGENNPSGPHLLINLCFPTHEHFTNVCDNLKNSLVLGGISDD